jgi:cellulose synthase/poly-beta-1,6-N-acetylglucosamine synthase-like glycosyltransferase
MKKFVIVIFFFIIIAVFVGFNYLLWERENREKDIKSLQSLNASNSITINTLNRQLENMENTLKLRNDNINKLNEENSTLKKEIEQINQDNVRANELIEHKNKVIDFIYKDTEPESVKAPIKEWAEFINTGDYESAYNSFCTLEKDERENLIDFTNKYKNIVKDIKLKTIKLYPEDLGNLNKENTLAKGDILFEVELDIKLFENIEGANTQFKEGNNKRLFVLRYNSIDKKWCILELINLESS